MLFYLSRPISSYLLPLDHIVSQFWPLRAGVACLGAKPVAPADPDTADFEPQDNEDDDSEL